MKEEKQNLYEGMYIISATLSEDARKKALEKIEGRIKEDGGEILKVHDLGKKRMAYEIEGRREGHYYVVYFKTQPSLIKEMWHEYLLNEDLIRFFTLRVNEVMEKIEFKELVGT